MLKYIKIFYDFLMKLKQFHFTHILIIPFLLFFLVSYIGLWLFCLFKYSGDILELIVLIDYALVYISFCILTYSFFFAIITSLVISAIQIFMHKKIRIKSSFLLNNKFYNILYLFTIFFYFILLFVTCFKYYDFYFKIYLFPFIYLFNGLY